LNPDSALGARALYARLRNSAENVCSSFEGRSLLFKRLWQACFNQAVAAAVVQVNRPGRTMLHNQTVDRSKIEARSLANKMSGTGIRLLMAAIGAVKCDVLFLP
jgi:hypothetical protein